MPSTVHTDVLDSALSVLSGNADTIVALSSEPASYADATNASQLANAALVSGDFTLETTSNGRRLAIAAKSSTASSAGTVTHIALLDTSSSRLLFVGEIPNVTLGNGDIVQFLAWSVALSPSV